MHKIGPFLRIGIYTCTHFARLFFRYEDFSTDTVELCIQVYEYSLTNTMTGHGFF